MTLTSEGISCIADGLAWKCFTQLVIQTFEIKINPDSGAFINVIWMNSLFCGTLPWWEHHAWAAVCDPDKCS